MTTPKPNRSGHTPSHTITYKLLATRQTTMQTLATHPTVRAGQTQPSQMDPHQRVSARATLAGATLGTPQKRPMCTLPLCIGWPPARTLCKYWPPTRLSEQGKPSHANGTHTNECLQGLPQPEQIWANPKTDICTTLPLCICWPHARPLCNYWPHTRLSKQGKPSQANGTHTNKCLQKLPQPEQIWAHTRTDICTTLPLCICWPHTRPLCKNWPHTRLSEQDQPNQTLNEKMERLYQL